MYRLGERKHSHRKLIISLICLSVLILAGAIAAVIFLKPDTHISTPPKVVVRKIVYDTPKVSTFEGATFKIQLPSDWKVMTVTDTPQPTYTWHGTSKTDANRWIDVYVDADLATFSINRVIAAQANGTGISVTSDVSDNCTSFTGVTPDSTHSYTQAKWEGVPFLCETGNYSRDVVGTSSPDGLNTINITGPVSGLHHYFLVYTDNSESPDYSFFTNALKSFQAK